MNIVEAPMARPPVAPTAPGEVTELLQRWSEGDCAALDRLLPMIYEELRTVARALVRRERPEHTLQATGLVHEAFIRLSRRQTAHWGSRGEFFGWAAKVMRHVLVDHARSRRAAKRGGDAEHISFDDAASMAPRGAMLAAEDAWLDIMALDEALKRLEKLDAQQARVVELRFFADLGVEETAEALGVSAATVKRDWSTARLWLMRELRRSGAWDGPPPGGTRQGTRQRAG